MLLRMALLYTHVPLDSLKSSEVRPSKMRPDSGRSGSRNLPVLAAIIILVIKCFGSGIGIVVVSPGDIGPFYTQFHLAGRIGGQLDTDTGDGQPNYAGIVDFPIDQGGIGRGFGRAPGREKRHRLTAYFGAHLPHALEGGLVQGGGRGKYELQG